ncbi:MAG: hypothetical protein K2M04_05690 [Muribaculaceae bacterium]|nr:hypothetical protein [Muribaculaceae bacterium]
MQENNKSSEKNLKEAWRELCGTGSKPNDVKVDALMEEIRNKRIVTQQERLKRRFRHLAIMAFAAIFWCSMILLKSNFGGEGIEFSFVVVFSIFMAANGFAELYLIDRVNAINPSLLTVKEMIERVVALRKLRNQMRIVDIVLAIGIIAWMPWAMHLDMATSEAKGVICGMIAGGVLGGIAGWNMNRKIKRDIDSLEASLKTDE